MTLKNTCDFLKERNDVSLLSMPTKIFGRVYGYEMNVCENKLMDWSTFTD